LWLSSAQALESQALAVVEHLSPQIRHVFTCGEWSQSGSRGEYRFVLVHVSYGAGTEVYVQRIQEVVEHSNLRSTLVDTTPLRELNNDHGQYYVRSARCERGGVRPVVDLVATFEHDEGNVERRVRVRLTSPGRYTLTNKVIPAATQK
jgi:hypothetical protein